MLKLGLHTDIQRPLQILCLGAHCDDIEIGCGGTLLHLAREYPDCEVCWVTFSSTEERALEGRRSAEQFLQCAGKQQIQIHPFRDGYFPYIGDQIKDCFEQLKSDFSPDLILSHCRHDLHQDHRVIAELTLNTFRNHLILGYEIAKYDADLGAPNVYVPLDQAICNQKVELLKGSYPSQHNRTWFDEETFRALLRLRGIECNAPSRYAEGFYGRKMML